MKVLIFLLGVMAYPAWAIGDRFQADPDHLMCQEDHDHVHHEKELYEVFKTFKLSQAGLTRRAFQTDTIRYCAQGNVNQERKDNIELSIHTWLFGLRMISEKAAHLIEEDCKSPDVVLEIRSNKGRAHAYTWSDRSKVVLFANSYYGTILHELGHSFGLADTYNTNGHPNSVMKLGRAAKPMLYEDDLNGLHHLQKRLLEAEVFKGMKSFPFQDPCLVPGGVGVRNIFQWDGIKIFGNCHIPARYESKDIAVQKTQCQNGKSTIGIFDKAKGIFLDGVTHEVDC